MADLYALYKLNLKHHKHYAYAGVGASYSWGANFYVSWYAINPDPPYDVQVDFDRKEEHYLGIMPQIGYDFLFFRNRCVIGTSAKARYNAKRSFAEYDWGFHIGVNF